VSPVTTATPKASPTAELQDFYNLSVCNLGLEQAIEMEKASLAAFVSLTSYAVDLSNSASLFSPIALPPLAGDFFGTATKLYASFVDLRMYWLNLLLPQAAKADAGSQARIQSKAKLTEHGMDAVVGTPAGGKAMV